jgi:beta-lactam-binding protein with PASTA domain
VASTWTAVPAGAASPRKPDEPVEVPDVVGLDVRAAAAALHRRGFRVRLDGGLWAKATVPAAGDSVPRGRTVAITGGDRRP